MLHLYTTRGANIFNTLHQNKDKLKLDIIFVPLFIIYLFLYNFYFVLKDMYFQ